MAKKHELKIVEGVAGVYYYHLSETGQSGQPALCGEKNVMNTEIPLTMWQMRSHLSERYCKECNKIAKRK